jgi:hypothetical protein
MARELRRDALVTMIVAFGKRKPEGVTMPRIRGERGRFLQED